MTYQEYSPWHLGATDLKADENSGNKKVMFKLGYRKRFYARPVFVLLTPCLQVAPLASFSRVVHHSVDSLVVVLDQQSPRSSMWRMMGRKGAEVLSYTFSLGVVQKRESGFET